VAGEETISQLASILSTADARPTTVKIATITAIDTGSGAKVQTSETGTGWISRDEDATLNVGDRVYLLNWGTAWVVAGRLSGDPGGSPLGAVVSFAGSTAPAGWHLCDGSAISRTTYAGAFAVLGTAYGSGDGSTTFNLPNLAGKVILGASGSHALGTTGGAETVTLATNQIPSHSHNASGAHSHTVVTTGTTTVASGSGATVANATSGNTGGTGTHTHDSVGSGAAHENMPPYQVLAAIVRIS
jgi:microcystin-dependent protein